MASPLSRALECGFAQEPGTRRHQFEALSVVIASDSDAILTKRPPQSPSLDRFALLAMTTRHVST